jgi:hypothetical protein
MRGTAEEFRLASLGSFQQLSGRRHIRAIKWNQMQKKPRQFNFDCMFFGEHCVNQRLVAY